MSDFYLFIFFCRGGGGGGGGGVGTIVPEKSILLEVLNKL